MKRCQTAERQCGALVVFSGPSFASMSGMGGMGEISSLEAVIEHLKRRLNAIIGGLWDIVAALGHLKAAIQ